MSIVGADRPTKDPAPALQNRREYTAKAAGDRRYYFRSSNGRFGAHAGLRADLDECQEKIGYKIREAALFFEDGLRRVVAGRYSAGGRFASMFAANDIGAGRRTRPHPSPD